LDELIRSGAARLWWFPLFYAAGNIAAAILRQTPTPTLTIIIIVAVAIATISIALLRSDQDWRVKGYAFAALLISGGLANYAQLQSYAAGILAIYAGVMILAGACRQRSTLILLLALIMILAIFSSMPLVNAGIQNKINDLANYLNKPYQTLLITFVYGVAMAALVTFILPMYEVIRVRKINHEKIKTNLLEQRQSTNRNHEYIFTHLPGITIELDQNNNILTASHTALNLLNHHASLGNHYATTWLATIRELPQLLYFTRTTGGSFQIPINNDSLPDGPYNLQATRFQSTDQSQHTLLTIQKVGGDLYQARNESLISQALQQYIDQIDIGFTFVSIGLFVPPDEGAGIDIQQAINDLLRIHETFIKAQCQILDSHDGAYFLIAAHHNEREIKAYSSALKSQQRHAAQTSDPLNIGVVVGRNSARNHSAIIATALRLRNDLSGPSAPEFLERTTDNLNDWSPSERLLLKNAMHDGSLDLHLSDTYRRGIDLAPLLEIKLLWKIPNSDFFYSEDTLEAIERANLVGYMALIQGPKWRELIQKGLARGKETKIALRLPKSLLNDSTSLIRFKNELSDQPLQSDRIILRINEADTRSLTPEQWNVLIQIKEQGFSFMLGEVGSGDSDIKLVVNEFFSSLQFSRSLVQQALDSPHAESVVNTVLNIAKELGKPTLAKAKNDQATIARLHAWGIDYVDTA
jgi:EAL domain-containing protein (putative c-di-GMP-specific phosphodiesterase class I)